MAAVISRLRGRIRVIAAISTGTVPAASAAVLRSSSSATSWDLAKSRVWGVRAARWR